MVIRKGHHPEGLGSGHREGEDKEVVIVVLTGAPNLLPTSLTLNGGYSHHLSSHTLSAIRLVCIGTTIPQIAARGIGVTAVGSYMLASY